MLPRDTLKADARTRFVALNVNPRLVQKHYFIRTGNYREPGFETERIDNRLYLSSG